MKFGLSKKIVFQKNWPWLKLINTKPKTQQVIHADKSESQQAIHTDKLKTQQVIRVLDYDSLKKWEHCGFSFWNSEYTDNPVIIGKIFEHLRTASIIRLYITKDFIEYSAETKKHGFVYGGCHRGQYMFFEFGLSRSGHRFDIYGEDRTDPTIKAFYDWWGNLVRPYEKQFDNDYNL